MHNFHLGTGLNPLLMNIACYQVFYTRSIFKPGVCFNPWQYFGHCILANLPCFTKMKREIEVKANDAFDFVHEVSSCL